ncbi:MAG: META domain-containing protein [bacterium]
MKSKYLTQIIISTLLLIAAIFIFNINYKNSVVEITQDNIGSYSSTIESQEKFKDSSSQEPDAFSTINILTGYKWVWTETHKGTGPSSSDGGKIFPKKPDSFALLFDKDGKFSAITDCNTYNGDFNIEKGMIDFTFFDSTKKICPESQEKEFISMLVKSSLGIGDDFIVLENSQSIIFKKEAK